MCLFHSSKEVGLEGLLGYLDRWIGAWAVLGVIATAHRYKSHLCFVKTAYVMQDGEENVYKGLGQVEQTSVLPGLCDY